MESHWKAIIERVLQSQRPLELDDDDLAELRAYLQSYGSGISIIDKALSRTNPAYAKKIADREKLRRCEKHNLELRTTTAAAKEKALLDLSGLISEALHRIDDVPTDVDDPESTQNKYAALERLEPAIRKAYLAFLSAEAKHEGRLEDREAWEWLKENGFELPGGATYELPAFDTWTRYLRVARNAVNERKYQPRTRRP